MDFPLCTLMALLQLFLLFLPLLNCYFLFFFLRAVGPVEKSVDDSKWLEEFHSQVTAQQDLEKAANEILDRVKDPKLSSSEVIYLLDAYFIVVGFF